MSKCHWLQAEHGGLEQHLRPSCSSWGLIAFHFQSAVGQKGLVGEAAAVLCHVRAPLERGEIGGCGLL